MIERIDVVRRFMFWRHWRSAASFLGHNSKQEINSPPPAFDDLAETAAYPSSKSAAFAIAILAAAALFSYYDKQILTFLVAPIKADLHLSDTHIGALQGLALSFWAGLAMFPVTFLVDRSNRVRLIGITVMLWSIFTALSGLCENFWQLFLCRIGVGIAEAGIMPAAYSLIADFYSPKNRGTATFVFYGALMLGSSVVIMLSGISIEFIGKHLRELPFGLATMHVWRVTLLFAGLPGVALALLFATMREPRRMVHEISANAADGTRISFIDFMKSHWLTVMRLCGSCTLTGIGVTAIIAWLPAILEREHGWSPASAGTSLGFTYGVGSLLGVVAAGLLTRIMRSRWGILTQLQVASIGALLSALTIPGLLLATVPNQVLRNAGLFIFMAYFSLSTLPAMIMNYIPNHLRGRVFAIDMIMLWVTAALSPLLIGILSDRVFHGPRGLLLAVCTVVIPCVLVSPFLLARIALPVQKMLGTTRIPVN